MRNRKLYAALMSFPLEPIAGPVTFLTRLCRENAWTRSEGDRAIVEYKKFLYLAAVSPGPVTPSDEVDQVWHLHLLYTKSYWEDLTQLLGRPLHHVPTRGGQEEDRKFDDRYSRTKALYEFEFGAPPPADLWPAQLGHLDSVRHLVIPRAAAGWGPGMIVVAAVLLLLYAMAASLGFQVANIVGVPALLASLTLFSLAWIAIGSMNGANSRNAGPRHPLGRRGWRSSEVNPDFDGLAQAWSSFTSSCSSSSSDGGGSGDGGGSSSDGGGGCGSGCGGS